MESRKSSWKPFTVRTLIVTVTAWAVCGTAWAQRADGGKRDVDIMTVNLYVGSEFTPVTSLNPADPDFPTKLLTGVATIYGRIVASNFPKRAEALARDIARRAPDILALQEVTLLRRQSPGDAIVGGTIPATSVEADYLAILMNELAHQGTHYAVASTVQSTDIEVPLATSPTTFDDMRLTDRDVILVRTDLPPGYLRTTNPMDGNFAAYVPLPIGLNILRGWCSIDVQIRGRRFRFINAHLEFELPPGLPDIQTLQAGELLLGPASTELPVVLVGDFNSDAYGHYGPGPYALLTGPGGFTDAWSVARPGELGLTWGHDEFLADLSVQHIYRLDFVLYRGSAFHATDADTLDPIIGTGPPLWFSDHKALTAEVAIN
jgi:endonuclease/exonuclease/phosphatase family metal-dependent hydrolase